MFYEIDSHPRKSVLNTITCDRVYQSCRVVWRVWRYIRGNQNPYIEEEQTTQWPEEKRQKDKQRSTKCTHKTKDRVTRTPLKSGGELRCSWMVSSSCSTSGTRHVNLFTNPVYVILCLTVVAILDYINIDGRPSNDHSHVQFGFKQFLILRIINIFPIILPCSTTFHDVGHFEY